MAQSYRRQRNLHTKSHAPQQGVYSITSSSAMVMPSTLTASRLTTSLLSAKNIFASKSQPNPWTLSIISCAIEHHCVSPWRCGWYAECVPLRYVCSSIQEGTHENAVLSTLGNGRRDRSGCSRGADSSRSGNAA